MSQTYLIVSGNVADAAKVEAYKSKAGPIMKKYGGQLPPENLQVSQVLAGASQPAFLLRIPFADATQIEAAFADEEYRSIVGLRDAGFGDLSIYIAQS